MWLSGYSSVPNGGQLANFQKLSTQDIFIPTPLAFNFLGRIPPMVILFQKRYFGLPVKKYHKKSTLIACVVRFSFVSFCGLDYVTFI